MRLTAIVMLVLAVAMGAMSVYLARDWLERQGPGESAAGPQIELTTVVVAKLPMNFGDTVTSEYLTEAEWPAATVPPGSFQKIEDLTKPGEGRVVLRAIMRSYSATASGHRSLSSKNRRRSPSRSGLARLTLRM